MHDGSLATLEDVIDYDTGGRPNPSCRRSSGLSTLMTMKAALVAFLRTLTDQQFEHLASEDQHVQRRPDWRAKLMAKGETDWRKTYDCGL